MRQIRVLLVSVLIGAGALVGLATAPAAHATGCPDPDYPCDPTPPTLPKVAKPTISFGCGTVTITEGSISKTVHILPCPGPVIF